MTKPDDIGVEGAVCLPVSHSSQSLQSEAYLEGSYPFVSFNDMAELVRQNPRAILNYVNKLSYARTLPSISLARSRPQSLHPIPSPSISKDPILPLSNP